MSRCVRTLDLFAWHRKLCKCARLSWLKSRDGRSRERQQGPRRWIDDAGRCQRMGEPLPPRPWDDLDEMLDALQHDIVGSRPRGHVPANERTEQCEE